jgi:hypothetical protein
MIDTRFKEIKAGEETKEEMERLGLAYIWHNQKMIYI